MEIPSSRGSNNHLSAVLQQLRSRYSLREFLGEGQYGQVWRCKERATGKFFALKYVNLSACSDKARQDALREVEILQTLQEGDAVCRSLVSLHDVYADKQSLYLVMELCDRGDLLAFIQSQPNSRLDEPEARHLFASVARGLTHCHARSVVHRDIKPENILLSAMDGAGSAAAGAFGCMAKLADFGLAVELPWWQQVRGYAGSAPYEAPEVMAREAYDESADVWSLGVTLYAMLSGMWPSFNDGVRRLDEKVDWELPCWREVSSEARDLIGRMMTVNVEQRITMEEVMEHPWMAAAAAADVVAATAADATADASPIRVPKSGGVTNSLHGSTSPQSVLPVSAVPMTTLTSDYQHRPSTKVQAAVLIQNLLTSMRSLVV